MKKNLLLTFVMAVCCCAPAFAFALTDAQIEAGLQPLMQDGNLYVAPDHSHIQCDGRLLVGLGKKDGVNGEWAVAETDLFVNTNGSIYMKDGEDFATGTPNLVDTGKDLDCKNVIRISCEPEEDKPQVSDTMQTMLGAANGNGVVKLANDLNMQALQKSLVEKTASQIALAATGAKIDPMSLPPEVLAEMSMIAKKYTRNNLVAFLKAYGKLLNWDDADIARLINLLSNSRIDAYNNAMRWAQKQDYAINGAPTRYGAAMEMKPRYDATTRGTIYFDFESGNHRVTDVRLDPSFEIRPVSRDGKFFVIALQDDGTPLAGQLFVDKDGEGNWVTGMSSLSERAEILPPTLEVQQAVALTLQPATGGSATKSSVRQPVFK